MSMTESTQSLGEDTLPKRSLIEELFCLRGRVALVTGSTRGLGYAMAEVLLSAGASVVIHGRDTERASSAAEQLEKRVHARGQLVYGQRAVGLGARLGEPGCCQLLVDRVLDSLGRLDILVNNAGINIRASAHEQRDEDWASILQVNCTAVMQLTRAAYPALRKSGLGRVVMLGSMISFVSMPHIGAYALSKGGVLMYAKTLALEWASDGITVNVLCPGVFATDMNSDIVDDTALLDKIPLRRWGKPQDLQGAVLLLASDAGSYITGQSIVVDGGFLAH